MMKYEVMNSKLQLDHPIYLHTYRVISISEPITIIYERLGKGPITQIFYDVEMDRSDLPNVRMREDFAKQISVGDQIWYDVRFDDFVKFTPDEYGVKLKLVV